MQEWPAWRYGPKGASEIFESEADVPKGWVDHPSKVITPEKTGSAPITSTKDKIPASKTGGAPVEVNDQIIDENQAHALRQTASDVSNTLDTDGQAWDGEVNDPSQSRDADGRWTMIEGEDRPDPAPGYPIADPTPVTPKPKAKGKAGPKVLDL